MWINWKIHLMRLVRNCLKFHFSAWKCIRVNLFVWFYSHYDCLSCRRFLSNNDSILMPREGLFAKSGEGMKNCSKDEIQVTWKGRPFLFINNNADWQAYSWSIVWGFAIFRLTNLWYFYIFLCLKLPQWFHHVPANSSHFISSSSPMLEHVYSKNMKWAHYEWSP